MVFTYSMVICAVVAVSLGAPAVVPVAPAAPVLAKLEEFDAAPQYSFAYDVQDSLTGDSKAQYESRNGDVVQGSYSLIEADGTRRIVDYTADPVNGFNAVVSREPAVAVAPVVAKTAVVPAAPAALVAKTAVVPAAPAAVVAKTAVVPAVAAPLVAKTVVAPAAVAAAPLVAKNVVAPAAPIIGANLVRPLAYAAPPAAYAAAPVYARNVLPGAPVAYSLPVPRAVATRLSVPTAYASPYAAYAVAPTYL